MGPGDCAFAANCDFALNQMGRAEEAIPYSRRPVTADPAVRYSYAILDGSFCQLGREVDALKEFQEGKRRLKIQLWVFWLSNVRDNLPPRCFA